MKHSISKISQTFRLSVLGILFGFSLMSFQISNDLNTASQCPTASFSVQNNGCVGPCAITFVNQSLGATAYHWDFGDGNTSSEANPGHTYQNAATYSVRLTALTDGCQAEYIGTVDIVQN